jgi:ribosomal protein S27AE
MSHRTPHQDPDIEPDVPERCPICGRDIWSDGLLPAQDGSRWICGDCDQARNFETLDL